ncbi:hypothetical protein COO60DRAFT_268006 [Scenedesmus sp. NREL 46B-D3]|nr:hypothetical protein COO60DRAFT_268006 [Scenedesmus sp. NREL 46B-D3]
MPRGVCGGRSWQLQARSRMASCCSGRSSCRVVMCWHVVCVSQVPAADSVVHLNSWVFQLLRLHMPYAWCCTLVYWMCISGAPGLVVQLQRVEACSLCLDLCKAVTARLTCSNLLFARTTTLIDVVDGKLRVPLFVAEFSICKCAGEVHSTTGCW